MNRIGATVAEWDHFATRLGLATELLPVVQNQNAKFSRFCKHTSIGKTPSRYLHKELVGITGWPTYQTTPDELARWKREPDYGICVQGRTICGLDCDSDDPEVAKAIEDIIRSTVPGVKFYKRYRNNSPKFLVGFRRENDDTFLAKRSMKLQGGGVMELLATKQQWIAAGTHKSGARIEWEGGLPEGFPTLTEAEYEAIWEAIEFTFGLGGGQDWKKAERERKGSSGTGADASESDDEVAAYLSAQGLIIGEEKSKVFIDCPWKWNHSVDNGVTQTAYLLPKTNGIDLPHFKCMHGGCEEHTDDDFRAAIGFTADIEFRTRNAPNLDELLPVSVGVPDFGARGDTIDAAVISRDGVPVVRNASLFALPPEGECNFRENFTHEKFKGKVRITTNQVNVTTAVSCAPFVGFKLAHDDFRGDMVWDFYDVPPGSEDWKTWGDVEYARLRSTLDRRQFASSPNRELMRGAILDIGHQNHFDTATDWLENSVGEWDGVSRIETFFPEYLKTEDTPYTRACGMYMWTALAARVLDPGHKCDMAIILQSEEQGFGKTSFVRLLAPFPDWSGAVDLAASDDNVKRALRGKVVIELPELRGMQNENRLEAIKDFVTVQVDEWRPVYMEKMARYPRRCIFIGTTNATEILADDGEERRWLPNKVGVIDRSRITNDLLQLWAEGREIFKLAGLQFREAERLARPEHAKWKRTDPLDEQLRDYMEIEQIGGFVPGGEGVTIKQIMDGLGLDIVQRTKPLEMRISKSLRRLGYVKHKDWKTRTQVWRKI